MLHVEVSTPSPEPVRQPTLADLSRNASVISSSSSSSSVNELIRTPRPRPIRTFSSPRSRSRDAPPTPRSTRPPAYLAKELGLAVGDGSNSFDDLKKRAQSRSKSRTKSRNSSVGLKLQASDFDFGDILGEGSYSTVVHATYPPTGQEYAIKILDKSHLFRYNKLQIALAEKNTLVRLGAGHPGIVRLHWAFHDEWSLFFVLDLARNGELQSRLSRLGSFSLPCAQYYAAQIVDAVAYMHSKGVIHRDLKPENLLLDDGMRIKITDFGTGKMLDESIERAGSFVGTAQYVSPELLLSNTTSKSSDIWAIGCIIYQMIAGIFPFQALSEYLMWQKVKALEYSFPEGFDKVAKDLVEKLLVIDPSQRLGAGEPGTWNDMDALRKHPFFEGINWSTLWTIPAPPLEPGLYKKEQPLGGQNYDVGLAWEQLVGNVQDEEDVPWTDDDGEFVQGLPTIYQGYPFVGGGDEIGPLDPVPLPNGLPSLHVLPKDPEEMRGRVGGPSTLTAPMIPSSTASSPSTAPINIDVKESSSAPVDIPLRGSVSSNGSSSSSEGSPIDRLTSAILENLHIDRGRARATTPIQFEGVSDPDAQWTPILEPGELIVFHSPVEVKSRTRRLTATLLPIPVSQYRPKIRQLVLTTRRLVCVKYKVGRKVEVKTEVLLRAVGKDKEGKEDKKDTRPIITDVVPKGQKTFIVMTSAKPQQYGADHALVERWISEIRSMLGSGKSQSPARPGGAPSSTLMQPKDRPCISPSTHEM